MFELFSGEGLFAASSREVIATSKKSSCKACMKWAQSDKEAEAFHYNETSQQCTKLKSLHRSEFNFFVNSDPLPPQNKPLSFITKDANFVFSDKHHQIMFMEPQPTFCACRKRVAETPECRFGSYNSETKECVGISKSFDNSGNKLHFGVRRGPLRGGNLLGNNTSSNQANGEPQQQQLQQQQQQPQQINQMNPMGAMTNQMNQMNQMNLSSSPTQSFQSFLTSLPSTNMNTTSMQNQLQTLVRPAPVPAQLNPTNPTNPVTPCLGCPKNRVIATNVEGATSDTSVLNQASSWAIEWSVLILFFLFVLAMLCVWLHHCWKMASENHERHDKALIDATAATESQMLLDTLLQAQNQQLSQQQNQKQRQSQSSSSMMRSLSPTVTEPADNRQQQQQPQQAQQMLSSSLSRSNFANSPKRFTTNRTSRSLSFDLDDMDFDEI